MDPIWFRLEALTDSPEQSVSKIWELGAAGVEIQDASTFMENDAIAPVPEGKTRLIAFFESHSDQFVMPAFEDVEVIHWGRYDDRSWETAWMAYFKPLLLAPRIRVGPPWETLEAPENGFAVVIEPGMAFGTGTHETTQLCATQLDALLARQHFSTVLDVGCGSAILSISARLLGADEVTGIDLTQDVLDNANENIERNGVDHVSVSTTPLARVSGSFDLVIANILAHILKDLRDELVRHVEPGGSLLLSGLTAEQEEDFRKHFAVPELAFCERAQRNDWVCLRYEKV